jgi:hypothetical protein
VIAAEGLPIDVACRVLGVSVSGYYEWRNRAPSPRSLRHAWLTDLVMRVHGESRGVYGIRRVHDRVRRQFGREDRDQLWVTDIAEDPTREGKV